MNTEIDTMNTIIDNSIAKAYDYQGYRNYITSLLEEGKTTGNEQTEQRVHYSELNQTRMNRLEKTVKIEGDVASTLQNLKREYIWLVISEGWCGDSAQVVPVIHKMAEQSKNIDLKLLIRDENEELMQLFLTDGTRSVPKLIILDKTTHEVLGTFGPRPKGAAQFMKDYKAEHGLIDEKAKADLQLWYFRDKGMEIQNEILESMQGHDLI